MDRRSWKTIITEFVERFDEAVIQGIMVRENAVLVKQTVETDNDSYGYCHNRNNPIK